MCAARHIPNAITFFRFPLTLLLLYFIQRSEYANAIAIFAAICLTDVSDGITARALAACTHFGAYMDVSADLFYVMASLAVLNSKGLAPLWFTAVTAIKFAEFAVTSSILKRGVNSKRVWVFDVPGRSFSALVFLAPGAFCFAAMYPEASKYVAYFLIIPACTFAVASSAVRVVRCGKALKSRNGISNKQSDGERCDCISGLIKH